MKLNKLMLVILSLVTASIVSLPVYSLDHSGKNLDQFLKSADLMKLLGKNEPLNLIAQFNDPYASTKNVDDFNEFIALGVVVLDETRQHTIITTFDRQENITKQIKYQHPWMGVAEYSQKEIPALSLQKGMDLAKMCMANKNQPIPEKISHVVIYKTQYMSEIIYDYAFKDPNLAPGICQEVLFSPATGDCQMGMRVNCRLDFIEHNNKDKTGSR